MTNSELEKRIAVLEKEVALLKNQIRKKEEARKPWWEEIAGTFADDPAYDEAMRLGREYRLSQREDYDKDEE
jgi:hypothetical protein